jgi:hypothetical protein
LRTTPRYPNPKAEDEDGEDDVFEGQVEGEVESRKGEVEGQDRSGLEVSAETPERALFGRFRSHIVKRDTDLVVCVACHFVWWRFINGGVEFAIGVRVGVLEVLR